MTDATSLPAVMRTLVADPGRPRLTWYGPAGERIELSGHVLDNWVTKTTNLLVEEYDAGPGTRVALDLPPHWRGIVWALAVWRTGACVVTGTATTASAPDLVVTDRPGDAPAGVDVVAVALGALARRFDGDLPAGAVDAASAVMTYADQLARVPPSDPDAPALDGADGDGDGGAGPGPVPHRDLLTHAAATAAERWPEATWAHDAPLPHARALLEVAPGTGLGPVLAAALTLYAGDGSLVLCDPAVTAELLADPARRERLVAGERTTA